MVILLLAAWVLSGLVLALLVGGAVRIADRRYEFTADTELLGTDTPIAA